MTVFMSDQLKWISNRAHLIYFKEPYKNLPGGTEGNYQKNYSQTASIQRFVLGTSGIRTRMVFQDYWVFGLCPSSGILKTQKNTMFRKLDLFPFSGEGTGDTYSVGPLRKS
jgi:hypothetical protein